MQITRIELVNFRNHQHLVLDDIGKVLIIVGDNAVGKTNIIEALQLLSMHESFRQPKTEELLFRQKNEEDPTRVVIDITTIESANTKQLNIIQNSKTFLYNKKERPSKELIDIIPAVLFTPDDLQIVKGPPEQRRALLDSLGARLSKSFAQIKTEYYKALRHKNSLLKQDTIDIALLDSWNINLSKLGTSLSKHRFGLFQQLLFDAAEFYQRISGGEILTGNYLTTWKPQEELSDTQPNEIKIPSSLSDKEEGENALYEALLQNREAEIAAKRSLVGPHKDDIQFFIQGHDARRFASQGQQRSIALSLKMAEIEILKRVSGKNPLLLLDDVMSELDSMRRRHFVDLIGEASQTVLTTTNLGYFDEEFLSRATVAKLSEDKETGSAYEISLKPKA